MGYTKHGFNDKVQNVKDLEAIYDIVGELMRDEEVRYRNYKVYPDYVNDLEEVKRLDKKLSKPWHRYISSSWKRKTMVITESKYRQLVNEWKEENKPITKKKLKGGIYGVFIDNKLVYIGKTNRDFKTRFNEHKAALENQDNEQYLYKYLLQQDGVISFKPLIKIEDIKAKEEITNRDLEAMELGLITLYQPYCNIQGRLQEYKFTK